MSKNNYAFAVAQVRSYENGLLGKNLYEQILAASSEKEVFDLLASRGWEIPEGLKSAEELLCREQQGVWELLNGLAPNEPDLKLFTLKNDYHNLKTVIKAFYGNTDYEENLIFPAGVDKETLIAAVTEKKYDLLPKDMRETAEEAYSVLAASGDGQSADIIVDRGACEAYLKLGRETESEMVKKYCQLTVEASDIKTAFRGAVTGKNDEFYEKALCGSDYLDKKALTRAARKGADEVITFLNGAGYSDAVAALKVSLSEFEKWFDYEILSLLGEANFITFGVEPLIAYGVKRENEFKNIRIALTCKNMGADLSVTEERMRIADV